MSSRVELTINLRDKEIHVAGLSPAEGFALGLKIGIDAVAIVGSFDVEIHPEGGGEFEGDRFVIAKTAGGGHIGDIVKIIQDEMDMAKEASVIETNRRLKQLIEKKDKGI